MSVPASTTEPPESILTTLYGDLIRYSEQTGIAPEGSRKGLSMARRWTGNMSGERYLANTSWSKREVHDLDAEKAACQIDEIISAGHDRPYTSLEGARRDGFDNCAHCIGNSTR